MFRKAMHRDARAVMRNARRARKAVARRNGAKPCTTVRPESICMLSSETSAGLVCRGFQKDQPV